MFRVLIMLILLLVAQAGIAQVQTNVTATGKHAQWIQKGKEARQRSREAKALAKQRKAQAKALKDTLSSLDSTRVSLAHEPLSFDSLSLTIPYSDFPDSINVNPHLTVDEERMGQELMDKTGLSPAPPGLEETLTQGANPSLPEIPGGPGGLPSAGAPTANLPKLNINPGAMNMTKMMSLMENISFEKLDEAHLSMSELKEKYSSMPSIADPSKGIKNSSLKGVPTIERFFIGGNMAITSTDPLAIDINLQLGYRIDRHLSTGVGVIWRERLTHRHDSLAIPAISSHGYSGFVKYKFGKGFFNWGEYSALQNSPILGEGTTSIPWQYQYLLGIGREFNITGYLKMNTTILYDFNYRHNDLHPRPFIVRVGYTLRKPGFKKKN